MCRGRGSVLNNGPFIETQHLVKRYSTRDAVDDVNLQVPTLERPATGPLVTLAGLSFVAHMLVAGNALGPSAISPSPFGGSEGYGYFRDELYYIADGHHLQAGYVDQPLLMGWLAALLRVTTGDGLVAIHIIPALACDGIIVVASNPTIPIYLARLWPSVKQYD